MRGMSVDYTPDCVTSQFKSHTDPKRAPRRRHAEFGSCSRWDARKKRPMDSQGEEEESRKGAIKWRVRFRLADHYCGSSSERCESFRTLPFRLTRYRRVKPRGGGSSKCPYKTTVSSRELIQRIAWRYEWPTPTYSPALGSPATSTLDRSVTFKVTGSYT